ncbi:MAG: glycine--tRNA ligase subunit beta [Steroidobacteraceae bacterium]
MSVRADFLVEVGCEELPPKALRNLELAFAEGIARPLAAAGLKYRALVSYATPRRLAVWVKGLPLQQPAQQVTRKGPPVSAAFDPSGAPTRAAQAFADSCGVAVSELTRVQEPKGEFLFYSGTRAGSDTAALLPAIVQSSLDALPTPKRMRWGAGTAEFVRPVHWVVMLFGKEVLDASVLDVRAGRLSRGHRFHAPKPVTITSAAGYEKKLAGAFVVAGFEARRARVKEGVLQSAAALPATSGGAARAILDEALLDEVTALVEWPVPVVGGFETRFLDLPREVLICTLQEHQRYFPVEDANGRLLPYFITLANIQSTHPESVRAGNERVVRPRLSDAAFFWEQDRKQPLAARRPGLDTVTYQARLGSVGSRVARVAELAARIADRIGADGAATARAAELCKCDLLSAMVGEFPELQGVMGRYYALADGEGNAVADAIREHYLPRGAGDELPASLPGMALAIADKLDTVAGIFALGQKPSGARDPFGVRRAAIGVLRILMEKQLSLDLRALIEAAVAAQPQAAFEQRSAAAVSAEIYAYVMERLRAQYLEEGASFPVSTEMFEAVLATAPSSPLDFDARLRALAEFLKLPEAQSLTAANKRIANILKKSEASAQSSVKAELLKIPAEQQLHGALSALQDGVRAAIARGAYAQAFVQLAALRPQVDAFFDAVLVNDSDAALRANRLALLADLRGLFAQIADLSRLPG